MKILDFYVSGQMITWQNPTEIIADSEKYLYCRFNFNSEWSGKEKAYRFIYKNTAYFSLPQDLNGEELVMIPPPVIKSPEFYIACGGYDDSGVFLPTAGVKIKVSENGFGEKDAALPEWNEESAGFTAQVLAAVSEANGITKTNKEIAESCKQMVTENNEQLAESKTMVEEATTLVKKAVNQPLWDIDPDTGLWMRFDMAKDEYVCTQFPSQGEKGEAGERGEKGDKGDVGEKGLKGDKGDTGAAGYTPQRGVDYWTDEDMEAVKGELGEVFQEKLSFDSHPTYESKNPVTSGGVYESLLNKLGYIEGYEDELDTYILGEEIYKIVGSSENEMSTSFVPYFLFVNGESSISGFRINTSQIKFKDGKMYTRRYTKDTTKVMTPEGYIIEKDPGTWSEWSPFVTAEDLLSYQTKTEAEEGYSELTTAINEAKSLANEAYIEAMLKQDALSNSGYIAEDGTVILFDNMEIRLKELPVVDGIPTLILNVYEEYDTFPYNYMCWLSFPACDVTPSVTVVGDISFSGVDCDETGAFTPVAGVNYRLCVRNIGTGGIGGIPKLIGNVARW